MKLHNLLKRQLNRVGLNHKNLPNDLKDWHEFIKRINNTYNEADQERYLLERSMEISSRELLELNQKLENAQHIAQLGYWIYDRKTDKTYLSKEIFHIFGFNSSKPSPSFSEFKLLIHEDDLFYFEKLMDDAFNYGDDYEHELRIKHSSGNYRWYHIVGHPNPYEKDKISGIIMDVTKRKATENEIKKLNQQLVTSARRSGMADVATSVLHNVGNILNSANVSLNVLKENLASENYAKILKIIEMLIDNLPKNPNYLTDDPQGKLISEYLSAFNENMKEKNKIISNEISSLTHHFQHIKDIVATQKIFSGISGINEKIFVPEVIDNAIQINIDPSSKKEIQINKKYKSSPFIIIDKSKLLQILVNLLQNAKQSVLEDNNKKLKEILISVNEKNNDKNIEIKVIDNGVGIPKNNLTQIFSLGFTTKPNGHGFGLHSSAIAAKELGGSLFAESKGENQGATFTLILPKQQNNKVTSHESTR